MCDFWIWLENIKFSRSIMLTKVAVIFFFNPSCPWMTIYSHHFYFLKTGLKIGNFLFSLLGILCWTHRCFGPITLLINVSPEFTRLIKIYKPNWNKGGVNGHHLYGSKRDGINFQTNPLEEVYLIHESDMKNMVNHNPILSIVL